MEFGFTFPFQTLLEILTRRSYSLGIAPSAASGYHVRENRARLAAHRRRPHGCRASAVRGDGVPAKHAGNDARDRREPEHPWARPSPTSSSTRTWKRPSVPTARPAGRTPAPSTTRRVTRREPNPHDEATLARPAFARDIEKILNVPAYNRYADKTQVFSFVENDDICRRGLHVQLVSRIARGIGALLGLNCELIEAIALGHDVGAHAVRTRRRALPEQVLPRAHRTLLQPQRALGARARPAVPPQREPADARRRAVPQRRVRPTGAARGRAFRVRRAGRTRGDVLRRRAGHQAAAPLHAGGMRRARERP